MSNLPGDFNEDNIIGTGADLVYLLSNLTDLSNNYNYNNDLTKNNSITTKDVDYLANHVAGTQGYELPKGGIFTRSHALGNIAIGHGAIVDISAVDVSTENSIAIGNGASAIYNNSIAIGKDVSTTATNQIVLGDSNHNLVINGNVGIGTTEPNNKLEIVGNTLNRGVLILRDDNLTLPETNVAYTFDTNLKIDFKTDIWTAGGGWYRYPFETGASIKYVPARYLDVGSLEAGYHGKLHFNVQPFNNETTRMTITSTGNVGIGTDQPKVALHISRAGDANLILEADQPEGAETNNPVIELRQDGGRVRSFFGHKSGSNDVTIGTGYGDITFSTKGDNDVSIDDLTERMRITAGGRVGIGINSPNSNTMLHVKAGNKLNFGASGFYFTDTTTIISFGGGGFDNNSSILANGGISSDTGFFAFSDLRIKTDIQDVNDDSALRKLRELKPKTYGYKDVIDKGIETVYGFIAQEVGEIIPKSVQITQESIPNIYQLVTVGNDNKTICFYQGFNTQHLDSSSNTLKILDKEANEHFVIIEEIIDASCIRVDTNLSELMGDVDDSGNIVEGNKVFVYGQRVDDFNFLKKDAIWTLATAALQEVDRQLQAEKAKTATLESQVATLHSKFNDLLNKFNILETKIQNN